MTFTLNQADGKINGQIMPVAMLWPTGTNTMGVFVFQITFSSAFNLGFTQILKVLFYKGGLTPGKQKTTAVIP